MRERSREIKEQYSDISWPPGQQSILTIVFFSRRTLLGQWECKDCGDRKKLFLPYFHLEIQSSVGALIL